MGNTSVLVDHPTPGLHRRDGFRVLVVDADDDTRQLYRRSFELAGCAVTEAADGRDALTQALIAPPSVVVTEMRLPFIGGVALCELLRLDSATNTISIVVVTGECRPAELERAREAGADAVLTKPALPDTVLDAAKALVTQSRGHSADGIVAAHAPGRSATVSAHSDAQRRRRLSKSYVRFETANPTTSPPKLMCPSCDRPLNYERSHVGGVSDRQPEQWDYFVCPTCGTFQYRQRTRKLRHVS